VASRGAGGPDGGREDGSVDTLPSPDDSASGGEVDAAASTPGTASRVVLTRTTQSSQVILPDTEVDEDEGTLTLHGWVSVYGVPYL